MWCGEDVWRHKGTRIGRLTKHLGAYFIGSVLECRAIGMKQKRQKRFEMGREGRGVCVCVCVCVCVGMHKEEKVRGKGGDEGSDHNGYWRGKGGGEGRRLAAPFNATQLGCCESGRDKDGCNTMGGTLFGKNETRFSIVGKGGRGWGGGQGEGGMLDTGATRRRGGDGAIRGTSDRRGWGRRGRVVRIPCVSVCDGALLQDRSGSSVYTKKLTVHPSLLLSSCKRKLSNSGTTVLIFLWRGRVGVGGDCLAHGTPPFPYAFAVLRLRSSRDGKGEGGAGGEEGMSDGLKKARVSTARMWYNRERGGGGGQYCKMHQNKKKRENKFVRMNATQLSTTSGGL